MVGGEGGIRTHGTLARTTVFETVTIGHSVTSPGQAAGRPYREVILPLQCRLMRAGLAGGRAHGMDQAPLRRAPLRRRRNSRPTFTIGVPSYSTMSAVA